MNSVLMSVSYSNTHCGNAPISDLGKITLSESCCLDTGLSRKVFDIVSSTAYSDEPGLPLQTEKCLCSLSSSLGEVGGTDNSKVEGDFSLMSIISQRRVGDQCKRLAITAKDLGNSVLSETYYTRSDFKDRLLLVVYYN